MKQFLNKNKGILILSSGLLFLLIGWFSTKLLKKDETTTDFNSKINTNITVGEGNKIFDQKIDAYEQEITDSNKVKNETKNETMLSNFGKLNATTGKLTKEELIQKRIDSIMNAEKISYEEPKKSTVKKSSGNGSTGYTRSGKSSKYLENKVPEKTKEQKDFEELRAWEESMKEKNSYSNNSKVISSQSNTQTALKTDPIIYAIINGDQTLKSGERINLRLTQDAIINNVKYPKNTFFNGFVTFSRNRINIEVSSIGSNQVNLAVYDAQDGNLGLYSTNSLMEETIGDVNDDLLDEISTPNTTTGKIIDTGKDLLKKKNKPTSITMLNRTQIILKKIR